MKSINDIYIEDCAVKDGDVKVNIDDLKCLFSILEHYQYFLSKADALNPKERDYIEKGLQITEYLENKYLVLGELRNKQKQWYDILKKFDDKEFTKSATEEEVENLKRDVWGMYIETKTNREVLQKEIEEKADILKKLRLD